MSLLSFYLRFPDDEACWAYLEKTLWPNGPVCPKCDSVGDAAPWKPRPHRWQCRCGAQFHVAQRMALAGTHLGLWRWFKAMYVVGITPEISSVALANKLQIRQKTAWSMIRRIRQMQTEEGSLLPGIVAEAEDHLGSQRPKRRKRHSTPSDTGRLI